MSQITNINKYIPQQNSSSKSTLNPNNLLLQLLHNFLPQKNHIRIVNQYIFYKDGDSEECEEIFA